MDHFGIGAALRGMAEVYFHSVRRTGRTTSLVESLKNGDRIVCVNEATRRDLERRCRERGVNVECVIHPLTPRRVFERGTPTGRLLFDHTWLEQYFMATLAEAAQEIDYCQQGASGQGPAHAATRQRARELAKRHPPGTFFTLY